MNSEASAAGNSKKTFCKKITGVFADVTHINSTKSSRHHEDKEMHFMKFFKKGLIAAILANVGIATAFAHGDHMGFDDLLIGKAGDPQSVKRTINIDMSDEMHFAPENFTAEKNETVRIVITNRGKLTHEFMLGTARRLKEQSETIKKNPEAKHGAPYWISVAPGATGEMVWKFSQTGKIGFACLQPGHFEAGMIGGVTVAAAAEKATP